MSTTELNIRTDEAVVRDTMVSSWRYEQLRRAGYPEEAAHEIADRSDVDLHVALELLERGCPLEVALEILR